MNSKKRIRLILCIVIPVVVVGIYFAQRQLFKKESTLPAAAEAPRGERGGGERSGGGRGGAVIPVTVWVVAQQDAIDGIRAVGTLVANQQIEVASELSGKLDNIYFREGSFVQKGQLLAQINDDDLQAQMRRYEFQKKTLGERVARQRILFEKEAISQEAYDQVATEYNVLLADMELLNVRIRRAQIRAPFAGVVGFRRVDPGSYIQAGTPIVQLVDKKTLIVEFSISEKYAGMSLIGRKVYFTVADGDKQYPATIYGIDSRLDDATKMVVTRAQYNNSDGRMMPGMIARVTLPTSEVTKMLVVPTEAVIPSLEGKSVWVVRNGAPVSTMIETGTRDERSVEVLKGLQAGDSVIVTGLMQLRDGARIRVTN